MSQLQVFSEDNPNEIVFHSSKSAEISNALQAVGVQFEYWAPSHEVHGGDSQASILAAFNLDIKRLMNEGAYQTFDLVSMAPDHPEKAQLREKFLSEHYHGEDEVRFFVAGSGLFSLHINQKVYQIVCVKGDLIRVPAKMLHWFDMGAEPEFVAIRLFNNIKGWIAHYSDNDIADKFPRYQQQNLSNLL